MIVLWSCELIIHLNCCKINVFVKINSRIVVVRCLILTSVSVVGLTLSGIELEHRALIIG